MDADDVPYETFRACLADIARINSLTLGWRPTLGWLDQVPAPAGRPLRVLDVGSGYGDMLRAIALWAKRRGREVSLTGLDLSPWSTRAARDATPPDLPIHYVTGDIFKWDGGNEGAMFDVVISSLFTHHLPFEDLVRFVRWMDRHAAVGWLINDVHRHPLPYHAVRLGTRAFGLHPMCRHDGPVSVARGFRREDWMRVLDAAGMAPGRARVEWVFPFRWRVGAIR